MVGLTKLGVGLPQVRLADDTVPVLVDAAEGLQGEDFRWGLENPEG